MAIRYSGDLTIKMEWDDDRGGYLAVVRYTTAGHRMGRRWSGLIHPSPHAMRTRAVDSPVAYDDIGRSALSFADYEGFNTDSAERDERSGEYIVRRNR
jgi:hypothetical protein